MKNRKSRLVWVLVFMVWVNALQGQQGSANVCNEFNTLNTKIRDRKIDKHNALIAIQELLPHVKEYYYKHGGNDDPDKTLYFPMEGYSAKSAGGMNGSGYVASGYDYFDGNKHGGHPAHDLFINDKNQDCLDDKTHKPVDVVSVCNGIVVATEETWDSSSVQRGGKYIWVYSPVKNSLFYYAHNSVLYVKPGAIVKAGEKIARVGRTGLNAYKKRSPTHLHFMHLLFDANLYPRAVNCFEALKGSRVR